MVASESFRLWEILVRSFVLHIIEVPGVVIRGEVRHHGRHAVPDAVKGPLVVFEERMRFDFVDAVFSEPRVPVGEEGSDQRLGPGVHVHVLGEGEGVLVVHDLAVGADQGLGVEGRVAHQHLVEEHAHAPPVALPPVLARPALRPQHLGADVVRGPHSCLAASSFNSQYYPL